MSEFYCEPIDADVPVVEDKPVVKKKILCEDPLVYTIDNYLTSDECDHFINVSKDKLKRAFVSDTKSGMLSGGRTGSNYWLRHNNDSTTLEVGERISKEVGIPLENAEAYQVVAYDETQKYGFVQIIVFVYKRTYPLINVLLEMLYWYFSAYTLV